MEYYGSATTPTDDFLAHYGVKGMKWGVRRAIERGNTRALSRHYNRAARKLEKLTARTDKEYVSKVKRQNARQTPARVALGGLASGLGTFAINSHVPLPQRAAFSGAVGGGMALANGIASGVENLAYRRLLSKKGYAKNTAKRKAFEKAMRDSFKGTGYAKQINKTKSNIHKKLDVAKQMLSDPNERNQRVANKPRIINKPDTSSLSRKQRKDVDQALQNWANAFEKHYQTGLSRGMTHEQAERYSNNYIAKHGFKPVSKSRRR